MKNMKVYAGEVGGEGCVGQPVFSRALPRYEVTFQIIRARVSFPGGMTAKGNSRI